MDNIFIKGRKLNANIPRFGRGTLENHFGKGDKEVKTRNFHKNNLKGDESRHRERMDGKSYSNMVREGKESREVKTIAGGVKNAENIQRR